MTVTETSSPVGVLRLYWQGTELARLRLPPSPPARFYPGFEGREGDDWCDILQLRGIPLARKEHSEFRRLVYQTAQAIPPGESRSYGWLARKIGRPGAARAVGQALGANPWPLLVPCHRVVRTDGRPGGFSSGVEWKRYLLEWERAVYKEIIH